MNEFFVVFFLCFLLTLTLKHCSVWNWKHFLEIKNVIKQCVTRCHRFIIIIKCILFSFYLDICRFVTLNFVIQRIQLTITIWFLQIVLNSLIIKLKCNNFLISKKMDIYIGHSFVFLLWSYMLTYLLICKWSILFLQWNNRQPLIYI